MTIIYIALCIIILLLFGVFIYMADLLDELQGIKNNIGSIETSVKASVNGFLEVFKRNKDIGENNRQKGFYKDTGENNGV